MNPHPSSAANASPANRHKLGPLERDDNRPRSSARPGRTPATPRETIARLERLARLMDSAFTVPGTNYRIGLDPIIGLIPGAGDIVGLGVPAYFILAARTHGAPRHLQMRMAINAGIDALIGAIPLLGDIFDFGYKSNQKNLELLRRWMTRNGLLD